MVQNDFGLVWLRAVFLGAVELEWAVQVNGYVKIALTTSHSWQAIQETCRTYHGYYFNIVAKNESGKSRCTNHSTRIKLSKFV